MNRIDRKGGELAYQFADGNKIKKIYLTAKLQDQLVYGTIALVKLGEGYELVPKQVAKKSPSATPPASSCKTPAAASKPWKRTTPTPTIKSLMT